MIHSNHEVKPHRARLVLPWGTRWEARVTNVFAWVESLLGSVIFFLEVSCFQS